jgi:predicted anti-sigma-YlaC factor YlaD
LASSHLDESLLHGYLDGELEDPARAGVEAHLAVCAACASDLERLRRVFAAIVGGPEVQLGRDLTPAVLRALSPIPRWVPSLAIVQLVGAVGIVAAMLVGLGSGRVLSGLDAAVGRFVGQLENGGEQLGLAWQELLRLSSALAGGPNIALAELANTGAWVALAAAAILLGFIGNGLMLGGVRRKVRS